MDRTKEAFDNTLKLKLPCQIGIPFSDEGLTLNQEKDLGLFSWDGRQWLLESSSRVDAETNTIAAVLERLILGGILMDKAKSYAMK